MTAPNKSERVRELLKAGMAPMDIAKKVGCTPGLVYNIKSSMGGGKRGRGSRGPGRKAKAATAAHTLDISSILDAVRRTEKEKAALRSALERMAQIVGDALGYATRR